MTHIASTVSDLIILRLFSILGLPVSLWNKFQSTENQIRVSLALIVRGYSDFRSDTSVQIF